MELAKHFIFKKIERKKRFTITRAEHKGMSFGLDCFGEFTCPCSRRKKESKK